MYSMISTDKALTDCDLNRRAPAIFATHPEPGVSEKYGFVPTIEVINGLRTEGWYPVRAAQTRVRDEENRAYARHMIRFRRVGDPIQVGDSLAELVLTNSHNRTAAYSLDVGLFRLLCSNGLVVSTNDLGSIKVRHGKQIVDEVVEASYEIIDYVPQLAEKVETLQSVQLEPMERMAMAESAMVMRYGNSWEVKAPITASALLRPRRASDPGKESQADLWQTYNIVQENLFQGGLRSVTRNRRRMRTRPIKNVTEDVRLNKALWVLAERMAELKAA